MSVISKTTEGVRMKRFLVKAIVIVLVIVSFVAQADEWFLIDAKSAEQALLAENPLPLFEEGLTQFFLDNPTAAVYFGSEMNLNNGHVGDSRRHDLGEKFMFGRTLSASVAKTWKGDTSVVVKEVIRLLFGPWYDKGSKTYSTQKNRGWFKYHLNLFTGDFVGVDPMSPDMAMRVFHITEYEHRMTTATLGVFFDKKCGVEGHYWCKITIIRKVKNGYE